MGNDGEHSATMRVLVADQEPEMLEAIARAFEVDVATSKATCIDLLRVNSFDVLVACERLSDGSGLELLSHVGQRWPNVIRILAIEPARRALLKGRLGPFRLFETISYPIDEEKLEAALTRAAAALAAAEAAEEPMSRAPSPARDTSPSRNTPVSRDALASRGATRTTNPTRGDDARRPGARSGEISSAPSSRNASSSAGRVSPTAAPSKPASSSPSAKRGGGAPGYPPLPAKGSKIVPLGSPAAPGYRIVPHNYGQQSAPGAPRVRGEAPRKPPTLHEKAAALAAAVVRYIKPQDSTPQIPTRTPPKAGPQKKR